MFDVGTLQRHLLGWLAMFSAAFADPDGDERPEPDAFRGSEEPGDRVREIEHVAEVTRTAIGNGIQAGTVNLPLLGGKLPGTTALDSLAIEVIGHSWDLSRATGLPYDPDPSAIEAVLAAMKAIILPEYRGAGMPFGPEVTVQDDAPALDRFVAFTGRDPNWAP
jgi:uncharacterized protein (TIGR03086 family)